MREWQSFAHNGAARDHLHHPPRSPTRAYKLSQCGYKKISRASGGVSSTRRSLLERAVGVLKDPGC